MTDRVREALGVVAQTVMQPGKQLLAVLATNAAAWAGWIDPATKILGLVAAALLIAVQWHTRKIKRLEARKLALEIAQLQKEMEGKG
ncbi:hypothetical protein CKO11_14890 [Rhodobacter sp. TJ_12]|uniref:hypothetical protein n=1 Tax=Rhodobacter sp. TJ_12 TaxID=2029399 RepID=UPI001CBD5FA3|nr:hypothetical protein [Rhodobacter sp. TJ_12]MBZ4023738.1 hypothetical protein [Rhodobacter sp. TJ_12]